MEWEELWNSILGEIGQELQALNRLVFEMEEKRHNGAESVLANKADGGIDLNELETIVEEQPNKSNGKGLTDKRLSILLHRRLFPAHWPPGTIGDHAKPAIR